MLGRGGRGLVRSLAARATSPALTADVAADGAGRGGARRNSWPSRAPAAGDIGRGVDGGSAFIDHDDGNGGRQLELLDEGFCLAGGGAIPDGDSLDVVILDHGDDFHGGLVGLVLRTGGGVEHGMMEQLAGAVEDDGLATGAETGVDG